MQLREGFMSTAFRVVLEGTQEVPPNSSTASGFGTIIFDNSDPAAVFASYSITIEGLDFGPVTGEKSQTKDTALDDVTRTHFHNAVSGTNGGIVFGQVDATNPLLRHDADDLSIVLNKDQSWTISGIWETTDGVPSGSGSASIAPFAATLGSATEGTEAPFYFNVHTNAFPGGEIRGQLVTIADENSNGVGGTAGNDLLPGFGGNDTIVWLAGKDVLDGGVGNDRLTGGEDADLFVFNANFGMDTITDLTNQDQIQFADGLFDDAQAVLDRSEQIGNNVVITLDASNTITLLNVELNTLQKQDFLIG